MRRRWQMAGVVLGLAGLAGCAAPAPQVVYVPYQPPAPVAAPAPTQQAHADETVRLTAAELRTWRQWCIHSSADVEVLVSIRDQGRDFTEVRDAYLMLKLQGYEEQFANARTRTERTAAEESMRAAADMAQDVVKHVFTRPYGTMEDERQSWMQTCLAYLD